jgi:hypothetical protein
MPINFNSISVISMNNIRSIRNSHGEARSSISCQDHAYTWMKQQSSWCNLSQNENVNKARLTYCTTTVLLLYCASINGDRFLKCLTNLICFYIFKAIFEVVFSMGRTLGSLGSPWLRAWLLDLQDRSLSERPAFLLAINNHLSWRTGIQVWEGQFHTICWPTNNQSQYNTWDSKYFIVFQNRKIFHLNFCENFVAIISKFPRKIFIICEISSNFMGRFTKISSFFLLFFLLN